MPPRIIATSNAPLFRLERREHPLAWAPTSRIGWGRFDDPRSVEDESRYRVLYAGDRRGCFLETLARFRPLAIRNDVEVLTKDWIETRGIASFSIQDQRQLGAWVDLRAAETLHFLHRHFGRLLARLQISDFDLSTATSQNLVVTQEVGAWAFAAGYHGIVYASRFESTQTCWAIFERPDMLPIVDVQVESIESDDPDLQYVIAAFGLPMP